MTLDFFLPFYLLCILVQQNFGRICKLSVSGVDSLSVQQFHDVSGDLEMVSPIGDVSPTSAYAIERDDTNTEMDSPVQKVPSKLIIPPRSPESRETYF